MAGTPISLAIGTPAGTFLATFGGAHIDHHLRKLTVASTVLFAISVLVLAIVTGLPVLVYVAAAAWGLAFGSSPSLFIGAAIDATKATADVAQSITNTTSIKLATLALLVVAAITVVAGRRHAFPGTG